MSKSKSKSKKVVRRRASKRTVIARLVARITPKIEIVPVEAPPTIEQLMVNFEVAEKAYHDAQAALSEAETLYKRTQEAHDAAHKAFHIGIQAALKRVSRDD